MRWKQPQKLVIPWRRVLRNTLIGTAVGALGTFTLLAGNRYIFGKSRSLLFIGEPSDFDQVLDEALNAPFSATIPNLQQVFARLAFPSKWWRPETSAQHLIQQFPDLVVGYLAMALAVDGDREGVQKWIDQARLVAKENPDVNAKILHLLPQDHELFVEPTPVFRERVSGVLWTLETYYPAKWTGIPAQASILRRPDNTLLIVNPVPFNDDSIAKINSLGTVSALFTPTSGHGDAISQAAKIWPGAKVYGTDSFYRHGTGRFFGLVGGLRWDGFLREGDHVFGPELRQLRLAGNACKEVVLYHEPSKSLLGLTDMLITTAKGPSDNWRMRMYCAATGQWRGPFTPRAISPNYYYMVVHNRTALQKSLLEMLELDVQNAPLGHGGYLQGAEFKETVKAAYSWLLEPEKNPSLCIGENWTLPMDFLQKIYFQW
eukprot:TRINITY_DN8084_c0_g1_i2.p1 TRINITY_DN8084_c0_g1~~TRINITY_DN8084_c0_g1_i2.p1  ORF type:complete len:431 (-),score=67.75 TRINITY_DN8084_c0_g1_i2:36-1328(-)